MKTLDRYIIRNVLINFVVLLISFMMLFVVVDFIIDIDEFLKVGRAWKDSYGGSITIATIVGIADYYGPIVVLLYVFLSGLLVTAAMGFTLASMARSRELVAVVASGVSLYRMATPILGVGLALSLLNLPIQEVVIPHLAPKLAREKSKIAAQSQPGRTFHYVADGQGHLFSARRFNSDLGELTGVDVLMRNAAGQPTRRVTADKAVWDEARSGWSLVQGYAVAAMSSPDAAVPGLDAGRPVPMEFISTTLSPTVLLARRATIYPRLLSMHDLSRLRENPAVEASRRANLVQIMWGRFSLLVLNVLILAMGLPFFLRRLPGNLLSVAVKAAGVTILAWAVGVVLLQIAPGGLNPVAAAWLPVALYLPVAAVLLQFIRT